LSFSDDESFTASIILPTGGDPRESFMHSIPDHFDDPRTHNHAETVEDERERRRGTVLKNFIWFVKRNNRF